MPFAPRKFTLSLSHLHLFLILLEALFQRRWFLLRNFLLKWLIGLGHLWICDCKLVLFFFYYYSILHVLILIQILPLLRWHIIISPLLHFHTIVELFVLLNTIRTILPLHCVALFKQATVIHHTALWFA